MDLALIIIAWCCLLVGLLGCVVPILPGVVLAYAGLVAAKFSALADISWQAVLLWGAATALVCVLDYVVPAWGTKKYGGSKRGVIGSTLGLLVGMFFGLPGIVLGPFVGAVLFELSGGANSSDALRTGFGSFVGLLFGTIIKLICCGLMAWYLVTSMG